MRVRLLCGAHVVWDCLFNTGYPGFGVPVPLFIGYLISNLILLKTNVYYHMRRILKRLQVPLPQESSFNASNNPYTSSEFLKICEDYRVPDDPMRYMDEKFYWTYQHGVHWPDDYIGPCSMNRWIIEKSDGFTDVGLLRISESVRAYAY